GEPAIELAEAETFKAYSDAAGKTPIAAATVAELLAAVKASQKPGLNTVWLDVSKAERTVRIPVSWVNDSGATPVKVVWDTKIADAVRLFPTSAAPYRHFARPALTCGGEELTPVFERNAAESILFTFPRTKAQQDAFATGKLKIDVKLEKETQTFELATTDAARIDRGPRLMALDGFSPFFCSFENNLEGTPLRDSPKRKFLRARQDDIASQGTYLRISNYGSSRRLEANFNTAFSIANYPVVQFRYRASDMAQVSMSFLYGDNSYVRLANDDWGNCQGVRLAKNLAFEQPWKTWSGIVTDAFTSSSYNINRFVGNKGVLRIGSASSSSDQTGLFSWLALDDIVFGPAVHTPEQLKFTPNFFDYDGVKKVLWTYFSGELPFHELEPAKQAAMNWTEVAVGQPIAPSIDGLKDGIHHIAIRAVDSRGTVGNVIDLPYMLDRQPLTISHEFVKSSEPRTNGTALVIKADNHSLSPFSLDKAIFQIGKDAKPTTLSGWGASFQHTRGSDTQILNYAFLFRDLLDASKDGDTLELTMDGIVDGAGNTVPKTVFPIKVDYAKDTRGPAWFSMQFGSSVHFFKNWDGQQMDSTTFGAGQHNRLDIIRSVDNSPFIDNGSYYADGALSISTNWKISRYPFVAMRLNRNVIRPETPIHLVLAMSDNSVYTFSLSTPGTDKTELNRKQTFEWKAETWKPFIIDVQKALLEIGVAQDKINGLTVKSVSIRRSKCHHDDRLRLDDFFIFGLPEKPAEPDVLTWTGFDASGVAGLEIICIDDAGKEVFTHFFADAHKADLNVLREKYEGVRWFGARIKDKAGKSSFPCWIPIFSPVKPKPEPPKPEPP
ncbi:MAG: hypothetical protein J5833_00650, partial [Victivallales bacterium]|nr:hypothetical protein [Victivallales bacterium]